MTPVLGPIEDFTFEHNTMIQTGNCVMEEGADFDGLTVRNNLMVQGGYGWFHSGGSPGASSISAMSGGVYTWQSNVVAGSSGTTYPSGTQQPSMPDFLTNFVDPDNDNYSLTEASAYQNAGTDGADLGCDMVALLTAVSGVV
jgi:hypothetical protein